MCWPQCNFFKWLSFCCLASTVLKLGCSTFHVLFPLVKVICFANAGSTELWFRDRIFMYLPFPEHVLPIWTDCFHVLFLIWKWKTKANWRTFTPTVFLLAYKCLFVVLGWNLTKLQFGEKGIFSFITNKSLNNYPGMVILKSLLSG